jgi:adenylate cyclase
MEGTFCFIDMAGFTALTEAHGDETAANLVERFISIVTTVAAGTGSRLVASIGDGAFVVAERPANAIRFLQELFARTASEPDFPALRAGLHHGEALERGGNYFGASVNMAARVAAQSGGCQVLGTMTVLEAAAQLGVAIETTGTVRLKNVRDPVELFSLGVTTTNQPSAIDPVCRMSLRPEAAVGRLRHDGSDYWFCSPACAASFAATPGSFAVQ